MLQRMAMYVATAFVLQCMLKLPSMDANANSCGLVGKSAARLWLSVISHVLRLLLVINVSECERTKE